MSTFFKRLLTIVVTLAMILTSSGVTTAVMAIDPTDKAVYETASQDDSDPSGEDEQDPYALLHKLSWSGLTEDAKLVITESEDRETALLQQSLEKGEIIDAFNLDLEEGAIVDSSKGAEVTVEGFRISDRDNTVLYHFTDNGNTEDLDYSYRENGSTTSLTFTTKSFSPFALVAMPKTETEQAAAAEDNTSAEPQSKAGTQLQKRVSPAGDESYIDYFYTQAFYGGSWKDTDNDGTDDHYVWSATNSAAGHRFSFRINYKIGNQSGLDAGKVEIRIPKHVIKDRAGTFADEYEMSVPTREEAESGTNISSDSMYAYYEEGDEIVIYNFRPIDSEQDGYIEVSYLTSETSFYYKDMEDAGTFSASMSVDDKSANAEDLHVMIDTSAKIESVKKNYPTLSKSWNSSWGTKPDDADNYWYLEWMITTTVDKTTTQPYTLSFSDVPVTADMKVVGYKLSGSSNYSLDGNSASGQTRVGIRYDHVLTRVPKDPYGTVDAWTNSENKWKVKNEINVTVTPDDGVDAPSTVKATREYTYTFKDDLSPDGLWNHWKRADGTFRTKTPKSVFDGSNPYDVFQGLPFDAGEYSRYDLDEFQKGNISSFGDFDYAVWGIGYTGIYSLMDFKDHNDPTAYFKNPVTYVLTDDDFNGDNYTAGARKDHHDGKFLEDEEDRLELTSSDDYQIDKLYYNLYIMDAKYVEDENDFQSIRGVYNDDDIVDIYAKFNRVSADWVWIGSYNYGTGELDYDSSYVKSMTKKQIVLQDNCVSYKLTTSNAHYFTALGAVPYFTLKNSDSVLNYVAGKDAISLYNGSNFSVYTADEYDPAEGAGFKETQIFNRDRYDVDFATGAERSSDIVKSVVSASNDSKAQQYVISWRIKMEENLKSGADGTQTKVSQNGGVFYDLLPAGCTLDTGSVTVRSDAGFMDSGDFSVRQIMNYNNTGRTMLIVEILKPGTNYNVYFNTLHSWTSIVDYGHDVYNPTAYQTGNEDIADGFADDGGNLEEATLMKDLDPDNGDAKRFIYAENKYDITTIIAAANGLQKLIREENDEEFSYSTFTNVNGNYEYRLRYSCTANMTTENLIFFDSLENYTDENTRSDWYGKLQNIDLSQPISMGIKPVVYLRADRFDVSTYDSDSDWDEVLASGWTEMSAFLASGHTLEDAKAVAIDLRHDENGNVYNLDSLQSVTVLLHMKAPDNSPSTGGEERYPWAYNNIYLSGTINHTDGTTQPFYNHHDYTAIGLKITGDVKLLKVNADNESETIQGISFHLWGKSDYGTDVDLIATSNARGMVDFKNVEKGTYTLQEYETTDDWLIDPTEYKVVIDKYGNTTITVDDLVYKNERVKITDPPRVHGDLDFYKMSSVMVNNAYPRIEGVRFKLSGTSDYGNDVLVYATSSSSGVVSFTNIEKGTYELVEIETNEDYILNETVFHVQVDSLGGVSILNEDGTNAYLGEQSGTQIVFNPPRFWSFALIKLSKDGTPHTLQGAEFALTGTSNLGTVYGSKTETVTDPDSGEESTVTTYDKYGVSDEHGLIAFDDIEAGTYKLFETKAPTGLNEDGTTGGSLNYQLDPTEYVVVIKDDGTVVIDGMEQDEDGTFLKGAWLVYNTLKLDKQITVYKHWDPSAPEEDYDWGERTADPEGEKNGPTVYISSKDPTAQSSDNGSSNNSNNNSSDDSSSPDNDSESNPADKAGTVSDAADRSVFAGGVSDASRKSVLNVVSDAWDAVSSMLLVTVNAADDDIASGTCGECSWVIDADGVLTISPTDGVSGTLGNLNSQTGTNNLWNSPSNRSKITKVYVEPGVKSGTGLVAMFFNCSNLTEADLHNLDTSNATSMLRMFCDCYKLTTLNISGFNTSKVTNMKEMFSYCEALENVDVSGFDTSKVTNMAQMFERCSSLQSLDVSGFNTAKVTDMHRMFLSCGKLPSLDVSGFDTAKVTTMEYMFSGCSSLPSLDVSGFNTSNVTRMDFMFSKCSSLPSLDVSGFNTSKVTRMGSMFSGCSSLPSLDVSGFDTAKVTDMNSMFSGCSSLTSLDVSNFDTAKVTDMGAMFSGCSSLPSLDVSNFDTANVAYMGAMFSGCSSLPSLDVSNFDTAEVKTMYNMFNGCSSLSSLDVSNFDTAKVTSMTSMFRDCSSLPSLDVSKFDTANVTSMVGMFSGCSNVPSLDVSGFDTAKVTDMKEMFKDCSSLSSLDLSSFDTSSINNARYLKDILSGTELKAIALGNKTLAAGNNWSSCGLSPTWIKYSSLTGKLAYNGETVDNIWDAKEYPGWYVKDVNNVPIDIDPYYEYVSEEDEQTNVWVKNGDVWSYTFFVADDTQPLYIWEDPVDGFSSSADVSTPIKYEPGTDQIISITNSSEETGSLELKKVVTGEGSGTFTFNITLTGNGIKGGQVFGDVAFYDGVGTVSLAGGESVTLTGIPVGTEYSVSEDTPAGYSASWEGDTSGTISKDNKVSLTCTNTPPSPPPEETVDLTVTKAVRGHFNNSGEYTFTATFGGLAAGIEYSYSINGADANTYTADASGNASVTFTLKDSESAVFYKLPVGATYQITEDGGNWTASYTVTDSNGGDKIAGSAGSGSAGAALSTSTETADKDEDVTVAYTNVVEKAQDIKLIKRVKTVGNEKVDDEFAFTIVLNGLEPLAYYHTDIGTIRADNDGHAERQFSMKQDDEIFIYGVPVGATYKITESACPYIASFVAENGTEYGEIENPGAENDKVRESLSTDEETVEEGEETTITFTNTSVPMTEVSVLKVWDDDNDKAGERAPSIKVQLYADGTAVGDPVVLNRTCEWKHTWTKLDVYKDASAAEPVKIVYTVDELDVPKHYVKTSLDGDAENGFTITNKYRSGEGEIKAQKNLTGREWSADDSFEFTITPVGDAPAFPTPTVNVTKDSEGYTESFGKVTFTEEGTYQWTVSEAHKGETINGITYAKEDQTITIKVVDDGKGNLVADTDSALVQTAEFTNSYSAAGVGEIEVQKVLDGRPWKDGDKFTFTISGENGAPMPDIEEITITDKDKDHVRSFGEIEFTKAGKYTYTIREVKGNDEGIVYDTKAHTVTIEVVDDGNGTLVAKDGTALFQRVTIINPCKSKKDVKTGDDSGLVGWLALMMMSVVGGTAMIYRRRREE